jgi:phosphatidylglycerol:prolipoprotein diacylglycerol transferase
MFKSPGSIAFTIGAIDIHWYGIIMSFSILFALFVINKIRNKYFQDISVESILDLSFILIIFGLLGARIYYVILDYNYFLRHPFEVFAIWHGGISIQGAIIAGILAGIFYSKKHNLKFFRYADLFSLGINAGQITGRLGNFFNSEAFGLPTNLPWKLYIPYVSRPIEYKTFDFFHPTFLYESILSTLIFIILYNVLKKSNNRIDGLIFFYYLILYSIARCIVETIRIDSVLNFGIFHIAHITSILFILIAIIGIYYLKKKART